MKKLEGIVYARNRGRGYYKCKIDEISERKLFGFCGEIAVGGRTISVRNKRCGRCGII